VKLDAAINFTPVGDVVPAAMAALDKGGVLACAGIYMSDVPPLAYETQLFYEKEIRSVTANTRADGEDCCARRPRSRSGRTSPPSHSKRQTRPSFASKRIGSTGRGVLTMS